MKTKIKKNDYLYQDALIWMGYRYAIGLMHNGDRDNEEVNRFLQYSRIEYDTPEFHALATEITNYLKRKKISDVMDLSSKWMERDMMWYSIHYGVGSRTYAGSHCHDIIRHGREALTPERREFLAYDIRREITNQLIFTLNFHLPIAGERRLDPIDLLMKFLIDNNIQKEEQLAKFSWIEVKENPDSSIRFETSLAENPSKTDFQYFFSSTVNNLLGWDDLAKYFDPKMHKRCRICFKGDEQVIEYFDSWCPISGQSDQMPYEKLKKPINIYEKNPHLCSYINPKYIVEHEV